MAEGQRTLPCKIPQTSYAFHMPYIPPHIQNLKPYQSARDLYQGDFLFLDANENCFGSLVGAEDLLNEDGTSKVDVSAYPDTDSTALRKVLAKYYEVDTDEVAIFNGSDASIPELIIAFSDPGDFIAGLDIGFGMYRSFTEMQGRKYLAIPTDENFNLIMTDEGKKELESALKKARVFFLDTPNNPSGNAQSRETIEWLIEKTGETGTLLIIDEAYNEFMDDPKDNSFVKIVPKLSHVFVSKSFSKQWSMAGGRIGVLIGNKDLIKTIIRVRIPYHMSAMSQALGIAAIGKKAEMESRCALIKEYRERLTKDLKAIKFSDSGYPENRDSQHMGGHSSPNQPVFHVYPSQTNFLLVRFPENSSEIFDRLVNNYKIVLRYFGGGDALAGKDNKLAHCVRITVGTPEQNEQLVNALKKILTNG